MCFKRTILFFAFIDHAFEVVIFIPDYVLSHFVTIEVDVWLEDVMVVGVDLLTKVLFVFYSPVEFSLFCLEGFVVAAED